MSKKLTKVEKFEILKDLVAGNDEMISFIDHEIELLSKKNGTRKMTKAQLENEGLKTDIIDNMVQGKAYTITDLMKSIPSLADLSNQRVSALVRQLKEGNLVIRTEEKGKAYFTKA